MVRILFDIALAEARDLLRRIGVLGKPFKLAVFFSLDEP
jgi:hypothetical protein